MQAGHGGGVGDGVAVEVGVVERDQDAVELRWLSRSDARPHQQDWRSGVKRWALGSVADKVLHAAKAPVLLVRAQSELA